MQDQSTASRDPETDWFHLSIVATSRNDNHGGYLTYRMQHFVDGLVTQCRRHGLRAELVLVEWNPPADRPSLIEQLRWPAAADPCRIRIITVPREVHASLPHSGELPLFQMIAKNVGIRRARGRFVLATNIDILFSDAVMRSMRNALEAGRLYRAERHDVPNEVPAGVPFDRVLDFCRDNTFRKHVNGVTLVKRDGVWHPKSGFRGMLAIVGHAIVRDSKQVLAPLTERLAGRGGNGRRNEGRLQRASGSSRQSGIEVDISPLGLLRQLPRKVSRVTHWFYEVYVQKTLFANACGDYTLLSREDWFSLRGYPEWPMYSWHLDTVLLYQANRNGIREVFHGKRAPVYHIEHEPGSGFTPEAPDKLFARLEARGIPYLDWTSDVLPMIGRMDAERAAGKQVTYNDHNWGFADRALPEVWVDEHVRTCSA